MLLEDGSLRPLARRDAPRLLQGRPRLAPGSDVAFLPCAGGWIQKLDLRSLELVAQAPAGAALRTMDLSADGQWLLAGAEPRSLVLFDADLRAVRDWRPAALDGRFPSEVAQVLHDAPRRSFVVGFTALPELWEISHDPAAEPIFEGLVHDYRMGEGLARSGFLAARRAPLDAPATPIALAAQGRLVLASADAGRPALEMIHLDVRRRIARVPLAAVPHPDACALFVREGRELLAVGSPAGLQVVDPAAGRVLRSLPLGTVAFVRSHPAVPHLWIVLRDQRDEAADLVLVDKESFEVAARPPVDGIVSAAPAFTPGAAQVLLPLASPAAGLRVHDARTARTLGWLPTGAAPVPWPLRP